MVQYLSSLDMTFAALSDPTRRAILARLGGGESSVSKLARPFAMSLTGFSKHLAVLETAGLLKREKIGRVVHCRLEAAGMRDAAQWLADYQRFWSTRLDSLALYLEKTSKEDPPQ
jgi:DNA-binding transcriptional ArsR family regulator